MLKPKKTIKIASLNLQCGECIHFNTLPLYSEVCNQLGIQKYATAPHCFVPNSSLLIQSIKLPLIEQLSNLIKDIKAQDLRILASLINQASEIVKHGFQWGQVVYFTLGYDYATHYFRGYIVGISNEQLILASTLKKADHYVQCILYPESCLTEKQWKVHCLKLLKSNKVALTEKRSVKYKNPLPEILTLDGSLDVDYLELRKQLAVGLYEPPTIDLAPEEVLRLNKIKKDKKDKDKKPPVVKDEINVFTDDL